MNIQEDVSQYYIARDIRAIYCGMVIAVDDKDWAIFRVATIAQMALLRVDLARSCNTLKFQKKKRGVKKTKTDVTFNKNTPHVSTLKMLSGYL